LKKEYKNLGFKIPRSAHPRRIAVSTPVIREREIVAPIPKTPKTPKNHKPRIPKNPVTIINDANGAPKEYTTNPLPPLNIGTLAEINQEEKAEIIRNIGNVKNSLKGLREQIKKFKQEKAGNNAPVPQHVQRNTPKQTPKQTPKRVKTPKLSRVFNNVFKEDTREMTFEEKKNLSQLINTLEPDALGKMVQIIHDRVPTLANGGNNDGETIEIDIDALDNTTLRILEKFVKSSISKQKKKRKGKRKRSKRYKINCFNKWCFS